MDPHPTATPTRVTRRRVLQGTTAAAALWILPPFVWSSAAQPAPDALNTDPLDPAAADASPAQAFASHRARASGIARSFAMDHPIAGFTGEADEDKTIALMAHCQAVRDDPGFAAPGEPPSAELLPQVLRRLNRGDGEMGSRRDYDMAVKGLMTLAYRYAPELAGPGDAGTLAERARQAQDFILDSLMPEGFGGAHPDNIEIYKLVSDPASVGLHVAIPGEPGFALSLLDPAPETENHLLMIESSRYLVNQLRHQRTGDQRFDNSRNGLALWLTRYMQVIARHDFLEFNARPYQRLALHPLFNLQDFAGDDEVRAGAQILLDYTMMKFAVSSTRLRRVTPFRRLQHRIDHQANPRNDLFDLWGDQVAGMFGAIAGMTEPAPRPAPGQPFRPAAFPASLRTTALIAGLSDYRPPPAAYIVALDPAVPKAFHVFHHGQRPELRAAGELAEPGREVYYRSPSFLMSGGGSFLNSGYGRDEIDFFKQAWEQTSRAQATTLIPSRAEVMFHDLIRFEPYPDPRVDPYADDPDDPDTIRATSVNLGVARGFMAGANLRPADKKTVLEQTSADGPSLALHNGTLFAGWKGAGNDNLNVARVQATRKLGIDGVEGLSWVRPLADSSRFTPALASFGGVLVIAWTGTGEGRLNIAFSEDHGQSFKGKVTFRDTSEHGPALAASNGHLYIAWTGTGRGQLNVAQVPVFAAPVDGFGTLLNKVQLEETSQAAPAIANHQDRLYLAWTGTGEGALNLLVSRDGRAFLSETNLKDTSDKAPCLASHEGRLFLGWKGTGEGKLNVAPVTLLGTTAGGFGIEGIGVKTTLGERSDDAPALGSVDGMLCLGWTGLDEEYLNLRVSVDGTFPPPARWTFVDKTDLGFWLAIYRAPVAEPDQLEEPLDDLGFVYAVEAAEMAAQGIDFAAFRERTLAQNGHLPDRLAYGGIYRFAAPDGRAFTVWFEMTGAKDNPRVQEEGRVIESFAALPLVSGEFMNAPGGHDGLIELRHPGCDAPVVLDFRNADLPTRTENRAACPQPWIDRALAAMTLARALEQQGRAVVAAATRAEGLRLYSALLAEAPAAGPLLAPGMIEALAAMGVDFSVPETDLRDWLGDATYTPYPAVAQALLLTGRRFTRPVYLDVIVWQYEHAPDTPSPRKVEDIRAELLGAAALAASNERYNRQDTTFDAITAPI